MLTLYLFIILSAITVAPGKRFDYIRDYLNKQLNHSAIRSPIYSPRGTLWLENSNTVGLGYNPLYGSPVCYTGQCQSKGFKLPVFKLTYSKSTYGSCTTKQIPDFVELHCIPNAHLTTTTETISTLKDLWESTSKGWGLGVQIKYKIFSAGYDYSSETQFMVNQLFKYNRTAIHTTGVVTYGKLSMFEPRMELSDNFRYIIDELDDVNLNDEDLDEFISIFTDYFGIMFVNEVLLGGLTSEILFKQTKETGEQQVNSQGSSHSPNIHFFITFNGKYSSSYNKTQYDQFMSTVEMTRTTKLGGDPSAQTLDEWIKTVPSNPAIVNFAIKDIVSLLTSKRFPSDPLIQNKSQLITRGIQRYLSQQKPTCYNNCTSSKHGQCDLTESPYFLLATCKCQAPWVGVDCSKRAQPVIVSGPLRGGSGGSIFNDLKDISTFAMNIPKSIDLRCYSLVDSIQMTYQTADGTLRVAPKRGGNGGRHMQFNLDADERIIKVTGAAHKHIDRLQFFTNKNRVSGACGGTGGSNFTEQYPGYVLSHISGRDGNLVDQIQFHWVQEEVKYM